MSQDPTQPQQHISPDGQWVWNGAEWVPNQNGTPATASAPSLFSRNRNAIAIFGALFAGLAAGWAMASGSSETASLEPAPTVTVTAQPEPGPTVTVTAEPGSEATEPAEEEATEAPATLADAQGEFEDSCDYLLDFDSGHTFVASAFLTNTGDVGFKAKVTATWRQANGKHVVDSKTVKVPVGDDQVEVYFEEDASSAQIDRIQSLETDKQCKVEVEIVDTI